MSQAFLALWNHYPSEMTEEYEAWHTFEHVPERLTAPGMRGARRYACFADGSNRYFTLYDLENLQTIEHPNYMDLVRNPTEWSARMRKHFSDVLRIPATVFAIGGRGIGNTALVQAYSVPRDEADIIGRHLTSRLEEMIANGMLVSFRIGLAEPNQPYEVFAQADRPDLDTFDLVLIAESAVRDKLEAVQKTISNALKQPQQSAQCLRNEIFDLVVTYPNAVVPSERTQIAVSPALRAQFGL